MGNLLRRRKSNDNNDWTLLTHGFDKYVIFNQTNGSVFSVQNDVAVGVADGKNNNTSQFYSQNRIIYDDIKDKTCRLTWTVECDGDISSFAGGTQSSGNITLGLYNRRDQAGGQYGTTRVSKKDIANYSNFIGHHSVEFVPSELFSGLTKAPWLGINIGFRSSINGLTVRITQLDFEVEGYYAEIPEYTLHQISNYTEGYITVSISGNTVTVVATANGDYDLNLTDLGTSYLEHEREFTLNSGKLDVYIEVENSTPMRYSFFMREANGTAYVPTGGDIIASNTTGSAMTQGNISSNTDVGCVGMWTRVTSGYAVYKIYVYNNGVRII